MNIFYKILTIILTFQCGLFEFSTNASSIRNFNKLSLEVEEADAPAKKAEILDTDLSKKITNTSQETNTPNQALSQNISTLAYLTIESARKAGLEPVPTTFQSLIQGLGVQGVLALAWQSGLIKNMLSGLPYSDMYIPLIENTLLAYADPNVATATILTHRASEINALLSSPIFSSIVYYLIFNIISGNFLSIDDLVISSLISGVKTGIVTTVVSKGSTYFLSKLTPFFAHSTAQQIESPLAKAAADGDLKTVKNLLVKDKSNANNQDSSGNTPLHYALLKKHQEVAKAIVDELTKKTGGLWGYFQKSPIIHWKKNNDGKTPLYLASKNGYLELVKTLCDHGALSGDNRTPDGKTPFYVAIKENNLDTAKFFLENLNRGIDGSMDSVEKIDANDTLDENQNTALHIAALFGYVSLVKLLLKHKADPNIKNIFGFSPLHHAVINGSENTIKALINHHDCDLLSQGEPSLRTPLHQAVFFNKIGAMKILLSKAKIKNELDAMLSATDINGKTALDLAKQKNNQEAIDALTLKE